VAQLRPLRLLPAPLCCGTCLALAFAEALAWQPLHLLTLTLAPFVLCLFCACFGVGRFLSILCAHGCVCTRHIRNMRRLSSIIFLLCARVRSRVGAADTGGELKRVMRVPLS